MAEALYRVPAAAEQPHQILAPKDLAAVWQTADQNLQALATAQGAGRFHFVGGGPLVSLVAEADQLNTQLGQAPFRKPINRSAHLRKGGGRHIFLDGKSQKCGFLPAVTIEFQRPVQKRGSGCAVRRFIEQVPVAAGQSAVIGVFGHRIKREYTVVGAAIRIHHGVFVVGPVLVGDDRPIHLTQDKGNARVGAVGVNARGHRAQDGGRRVALDHRQQPRALFHHPQHRERGG